LLTELHDPALPALVSTVNGISTVTRIIGLPVIGFSTTGRPAATSVLSHGIPPVIVAGMLGHSVSILLNTYAHFIPTVQDQAAEMIDELVTPTPTVLMLDNPISVR
jgi:hypothetical protein